MLSKTIASTLIVVMIVDILVMNAPTLSDFMFALISQAEMSLITYTSGRLPLNVVTSSALTVIK